MEVLFTEGDLVEWLAEPELREDRRMDLGDVLNIENFAVKCRGWIGDAPFSLDAERTAKTLNASNDVWQREARPEFADRFVFTTFGVQNLGGLVDPAGLGLELLFRDDERRLNQGQRIHIHTLFPSARFQVVGTSETLLGAGAKIEGAFRAAGALTAPGQLTPIMSTSTDAGVSSEIKGSASVTATLDVKHQLMWSSTTYATMVEAIGEGDTRALWVFHRPLGPLTGKTFETVTGLTLSRKKTGVTFEARMFLIFKIGPYPIRRYSPWVRLVADWGA